MLVVGSMDKLVLLLAYASSTCGEQAQFADRFQFYRLEAMELASQGKLLQAAGALRYAADLATKGSATRQQREQALFQLADIQDAMGYVPEQISTLKLIVEENADNLQAASLAKERLANALVDGFGQTDEALRLYRDVADSSATATALLSHGIVAASQGEFDESARCHVRALKLENRIADLVLYLQVGASVFERNIQEHVKVYTDDSDVVTSSVRQLPEFMQSSWDYIRSSSGLSANCPCLYSYTYDMLHLGMAAANMTDGLVLEFGVFHGKTIRMIADQWPEAKVHGFDTFQGIPEQWGAEPAGSYSTHGLLPEAPDNVEYHEGLFSATLPAFTSQHRGPVRFANIDCDLYSSTVDVFDALHERIVPGTVLVFDEYIMHPNWQANEYRAFQEAVKKYGWTYEYIGMSLVSKQAIVRIVGSQPP